MAGTGHRIALTGVGSFADQSPPAALGPPADPLSRQVAAADSAARENARRRLGSRLPSEALRSADQYFATPGVTPWDGARPEPGRDLLRPAPGVGPAAADRPAPAVELSQLDRRHPLWAPFADDLAAVTGSDVVLGMTITGRADGADRADRADKTGERPAAGWRRDGSDTLITVVDGAQQFAVASTEPPDAEPEPELETVLRAGDTLRLPRRMLHSDRAGAGGSALLSMKLRRATDWSLRRSAPGHLGFRDYPTSARVYRLCLRSHVRPVGGVPSGGVPTTALLRTRIPGGLAVLETAGEEVTFVAAGSVYRASTAVLRALLTVHAADGINVPDLAETVGASARAAGSAVEGLLACGLARIDDPDHA